MKAPTDLKISMAMKQHYERQHDSDSLVEVETTDGGSDAEVALLQRHHIQIHEVSVHLAVPWGRVPVAHGQGPQELQRLRPVNAGH